jgi:hypothetical protein
MLKSCFWIIILYHEITNNVFEDYGEIMKKQIMYFGGLL